MVIILPQYIFARLKYTLLNTTYFHPNSL